MAKTKKLNTDLDEAPRKRGKQSDSAADSYSEPMNFEDTPKKRRGKKSDDLSDSDAGGGDDVTYNMGDIQVTDAEDTDAEDFKKASQKVIMDGEDDGEEDWVDEDLNVKDEDIFLDMDQDYDIDNPYSDDDY